MIAKRPAAPPNGGADLVAARRAAAKLGAPFVIDADQGAVRYPGRKRREPRPQGPRPNPASSRQSAQQNHKDGILAEAVAKVVVTPPTLSGVRAGLLWRFERDMLPLLGQRPWQVLRLADEDILLVVHHEV